MTRRRCPTAPTEPAGAAPGAGDASCSGARRPARPSTAWSSRLMVASRRCSCLARLAAGDRLGRCCRSPTGTASAASTTIKWVGLAELPATSFTIYPPFWPAVQHNLIWLVFLFLIADAARHVPRGAAGPGDARHPVLPDRVLPAGRAVAGARRLHLAADLLAATRACINAGHRQHDRLVRRPEHQPLGGPGRRRAGGTSATSCCSTWPA